MAAPLAKVLLTLHPKNCHTINIFRSYSIKPPPSLEKIIRYGALKPDQDDVILPTLKQRIAGVADQSDELKSIDIGVKHEVPRSIKKEQLQRWRKKKNAADLEQAARLHKLKVPLDEVNTMWLSENGPKHSRTIAHHYGIYKDLFNGGHFLPVVEMDINYEFEGEYNNPVYKGNRIAPSEASKEPQVKFEAEEGSLWTLILTNPDGNLRDNGAEYLHWHVANIPSGDVTKGDILCDYLQPLPPKGTGFHRLIFILFEQKASIDVSAHKRSSQCLDLEQRTFKVFDFLQQCQVGMTPKGLAFFQSQYDDSVRDVFHNTLEMREPSFEYAHPTPYHPPQEAYPYRQPFDRYYDRYRDKKDLAEEVLKMKLAAISPFEEYKGLLQYPLVHRARKGSKPTWRIRREEKMHLRLEQFKDLP